MSRIIRHNEAGKVLELITDAAPSEWIGKPNTLIDPDETPVASLPVAQWRVENNLLRPATPAEIAAEEASRVESGRFVGREAALRLMQESDPVAILVRALLRLMANENARIKAGQTPRTETELRAAMRAIITAGQSDT